MRAWSYPHLPLSKNTIYSQASVNVQTCDFTSVKIVKTAIRSIYFGLIAVSNGRYAAPLHYQGPWKSKLRHRFVYPPPEVIVLSYFSKFSLLPSFFLDARLTPLPTKKNTDRQRGPLKRPLRSSALSDELLLRLMASIKVMQSTSRFMASSLSSVDR